MWQQASGHDSPDFGVSVVGTARQMLMWLGVAFLAFIAFAAVAVQTPTEAAPPTGPAAITTCQPDCRPACATPE